MWISVVLPAQICLRMFPQIPLLCWRPHIPWRKGCSSFRVQPQTARPWYERSVGTGRNTWSALKRQVSLKSSTLSGCCSTCLQVYEASLKYTWTWNISEYLRKCVQATSLNKINCRVSFLSPHFTSSWLFIYTEPAEDDQAISDTAVTKEASESSPPASLMTPNSTPAPAAPDSPQQNHRDRANDGRWELVFNL